MSARFLFMKILRNYEKLSHNERDIIRIHFNNAIKSKLIEARDQKYIWKYLSRTLELVTLRLSIELATLILAVVTLYNWFT